MDFPITCLMDEASCYQKLLLILHPEGLSCPDCGDRTLHAHRRKRDPVLDYRCPRCHRVFNAFTHTIFQGTQRSCSELLLLVRGISQGVSTAQLARELGRDRGKLLHLRHQLQQQAADAQDRSRLGDAVVECDEMYQNAGEKRHKASRSGRSSPSSRQQGSRSRHMGTGSSTGLRHRRAGQRTNSPGGNA